MFAQFEVVWFLLELALEEHVLHVHLMQVLPFRHYGCNYRRHGGHFCHQGKCFLIVYAMGLCITLGDY